ncbi:AAA family ATPase [Streptomyces sp. CA-100214]
MALLIQSKIGAPTRPDPHAERYRVTALILNRLKSDRVTFVTGPAGSGKSVAVLDALAAYGRSVAWVSLDKSERAPARFLAYLDAALCRAAPGREDLLAAGLSERLSPAEVAGLMAESLDGFQLALVFDDVDRLGDGQEGEEAWSVLDSFIRYAPRSVKFVLIAREMHLAERLDIPAGLAVGRVGDDDLALTVEEAEHLLPIFGPDPGEIAARVCDAQGWFAGVMFGGSPPAEHEERSHDLLCEMILARLGTEDRRFLVTTSVLTEVTVQHAARLGITRPHQQIDRLRELRLPLTWNEELSTLRVHPRFRDHLLHRFAELPLETQRQVRLRYAAILVEHGDDEPAVEEFLRAGAHGDAVTVSRRCILTVVERAGFALVSRWLEIFAADESPGQPTELTAAAIALAYARERFNDIIAQYQRLHDAGTLTAFIAQFTQAAEFMALALLASGRVSEFHTILDGAASPSMPVLLYAVSPLMEPGAHVPRPQPTNSGLDAFTFRTDYWRGRLDTLATPLSLASPRP